MKQVIAELMDWLENDTIVNDFFDFVLYQRCENYKYEAGATGEVETGAWDGVSFLRLTSTCLDYQEYTVFAGDTGHPIWSYQTGGDA